MVVFTVAVGRGDTVTTVSKAVKVGRGETVVTTVLSRNCSSRSAVEKSLSSSFLQQQLRVIAAYFFGCLLGSAFIGNCCF